MINKQFITRINTLSRKPEAYSDNNSDLILGAGIQFKLLEYEIEQSCNEPFQQISFLKGIRKALRRTLYFFVG